MKINPIYLAVITLFTLNACNSPEKQKEVKETEAETEVVSETPESDFDKDAYIQKADSLRSAIEELSDEAERAEISTDSLRGQLKQKWSKIDYYMDEGNVIRIKTYPHEGVSQRTEEFYFYKGELILVVIEDDGSGSKGKDKSQLDKIYYFHDDSLVEEINNSQETEYGIRQSDSERLIQEAREYLKLLK